jgi:hypothetical protein
MKTQVLDELSSELMRAITTFRVRSTKRDIEIDMTRMSLVLNAVEDSLQQATAERSGLIERVRAIISQPEVALARTFQRRESRPEIFAQEWAKAEERLGALERQIAHLKFLRASILMENPGVHLESR